MTLALGSASVTLAQGATLVTLGRVPHQSTVCEGTGQLD